MYFTHYLFSKFLHKVNFSLLPSVLFVESCVFVLVFVLGHVISLDYLDRKTVKELSNLREKGKAKPEIQNRETI